MKKGFTLMELLAVIIILAIIALVATPLALDIIEDAKTSAEISEVYQIVDAAKMYYAESLLNDEKAKDMNGKTDIINKLVMSNEIQGEGQVYVNESGKVALAIIKDDKCFVKDYNSKVFVYDDIENCIVFYKDSTLNGADPVLDEGMIPVVIASDGTLTKADLRNEWYNYTNKQWANIVLVTESSRNEYMEAESGSEIKQDDVLAYYVWIPRYKYQIFTDINNILVEQDYETNTVQLINIEFEDKYKEKSTGTNKDEWLTHPAFTFGNDELNGIWVGKFETSGSLDNPKIIPNKNSLVNLSVSDQFKSSLKFANNTLNNDGSITHSNNNVYGINETDAHMMKNTEWGAVAYLTTSIYGQGLTEVRINNSSQHLTGCAATTVATKTAYDYLEQSNGSEGYFKGCENKYNTEIGFLASTTGNITGIYDMNGGTWEHVMAVIEDALGSRIPLSGRSYTLNSGFTGNLGCPTCEESGITRYEGISFPDSKYYDIYTYGEERIGLDAYSRGKLGDATIELGSFAINREHMDSIGYNSTWHQDFAYMVVPSVPWMLRSGTYYNGSDAGIFNFEYFYGHPAPNVSFRSVLVNN